MKLHQLKSFSRWKHPVLFSVTTFFLNNIAISIVGMGLSSVVSLLIGGELTDTILNSFFSVLLTVLFFLHWRKKCPYPLSFNRNAAGFFQSLCIGWPVLVYSGLFIAGFITTIPNAAAPVLPTIIKAFFTALIPGVCEEVSFRFLILPCLLFYFKDKKNGIYYAAAISGFFFGFVHLFNFIGQSGSEVLLSASLQFICTAGLGIFLASIFLRTKNIPALILLHAHIDFFGMAWQNLMAPGNSSENGTTTLGLIFYITVGLVLTASAFWNLRQSRHGEIRKLWALSEE